MHGEHHGEADRDQRERVANFRAWVVERRARPHTIRNPGEGISDPEPSDQPGTVHNPLSHLVDVCQATALSLALSRFRVFPSRDFVETSQPQARFIDLARRVLGVLQWPRNCGSGVCSSTLVSRGGGFTAESGVRRWSLEKEHSPDWNRFLDQPPYLTTIALTRAVPVNE
jgi:hypothetical protein